VIIMEQPRAKKYLTPLETASLLQVTEGTLRQWRYMRKGPRFIKTGRKVLYDIVDIETWIAKRKIQTQDAPGPRRG